jgi:hypothetical protein
LSLAPGQTVQVDQVVQTSPAECQVSKFGVVAVRLPAGESHPGNAVRVWDGKRACPHWTYRDGLLWMFPVLRLET